jgi:hypothetical protein
LKFVASGGNTFNVVFMSSPILAVGDEDGLLVGKDVVNNTGEAEGREDGIEAGLNVGWAVGKVTGSVVGCAEGKFVGPLVGWEFG